LQLGVEGRYLSVIGLLCGLGIRSSLSSRRQLGLGISELRLQAGDGALVGLLARGQVGYVGLQRGEQVLKVICQCHDAGYSCLNLVELRVDGLVVLPEKILD
jgi:hypothetical protein